MSPSPESPDRPTVLLTGGTGQIGHALQTVLDGTARIDAPGRDRLDLARPESIREAVRSADPDWIINTAAHTAVDDAEDEPDRARILNAEAPGVLAEEAARAGAWMVQYSTDYVFDGQADRPYRESDPTNPLGVYGRTKLAGERAVESAGGRHLILRTSWVYSHRRTNFLRTMLRLARECRAGKRDGLTVVDDQTGTPTSAGWIARATRAIMQAVERRGRNEGAEMAGCYHLVGRGQTSWYGFARAIFAQYGFDDVSVEPVGSDAYPQKAPRPAYSVLDPGKARDAFGIDVPTWTAQLDRFRERHPQV